MDDIFNMLVRSLEKNEFDSLLRGEKGYALPTPYMCPASELPTDWPKLLKEGVYRVFKDQPVYEIDKRLEESLLNIARDIRGIYSSLNIFWIQLMNEEFNESPFILKKGSIIKFLSQKIIENKKNFIKEKIWMGENNDDGLWGEIKRICNIIYEDYKISIICT